MTTSITTTLAFGDTIDARSSLPTAILGSTLTTVNTQSKTRSVSLATDSSFSKCSTSTKNTSFYSNLRILTDSSSLVTELSSTAGVQNGGLEISTTAVNSTSSNAAISNIEDMKLNWKLGVVIPSLFIIPCLL